jgi:phosphate transport system permease protein
MSERRESSAHGRHRPFFVTAIAVLLGVGTVAVIAGGIMLSLRPEGGASSRLQTFLAAVIVAALGIVLARGLWRLQNWARTAVILLLVVLGLYYGLTVVFDAAAEIFGGEQVVPVGTILNITFKALLRVVATGFVPVAMIYGLSRLGADTSTRLSASFYESPGQRAFMDRGVRYILLATALSSIFIVFLIIVFTVLESREAIEKIGLRTMLLGTVWRPGSIIGTEEAQFGLIPMIIGSILATFGAAVLGVPLSIGTAILLAEVAPPSVREVVRPAVELLAGIPSVVYGLFGMVVLAPLIRKIQVPYNTGFGLLNASIVLAVMTIPTVTNIAEDALRAVPKRYKEGSLALGATHWQTIIRVLLPAARSGIVAAVILGIGRALGETMAMIMVIGNSIAIPKPLNDNPLTLFLSTARTLTGNIAVEINYAAGAHRSALFFTGVLLFVMILLVNSLARYLMRERLPS